MFKIILFLFESEEKDVLNNFENVLYIYFFLGEGKGNGEQSSDESFSFSVA